MYIVYLLHDFSKEQEKVKSLIEERDNLKREVFSLTEHVKEKTNEEEEMKKKLKSLEEEMENQQEQIKYGTEY